MNSINKTRKLLMDCNPLIHCITNPISITQCANAVLAVGARPIMAEHPLEVEEISRTAASVVLNTGNITDARMESMLISAKSGTGYVLDPVGITCSQLRQSFVQRLIRTKTPAVIKGNYSEIYALFNSGYKSEGIDSDLFDESFISSISAELAEKLGTVIAASGKTDIITDGKRILHIKNGTSHLAKVTGTGCMLGALCGCFLAVSDGFSAAYTACAVLGIAGELAKTHGTGSFSINLMDRLSTLCDNDIEKYLNKEEFEIEKI